MTTMDAIHELAASYALGALNTDERREFERHLADCERCQRELSWLADAAAALALALEPVLPPTGLRDRILADARRGGAVIPFRRRAAPVAAAAAALAACAAIGLGVWAASLHGSLSRERDSRAAQEAALAVLSDPGARRVPLQSRRGILAVRPNGTAALAVANLGRAPSGKTYEAWVVERQTPRPAGLFKGGSEGATVVALERRVPRGAIVAVTVERAGGVTKPTPPLILTASA
jgi:anti-sigma-K factor RskA